MAAEKSTADAAEAAASGGLPQFAFDLWAGQIFWLVLTFGIMYFVLSRFILPRIGQGITDRGDRIADDLDEASRMQQEAKQAEIDYERAVADARAKAHNISEATRKSVDAEIEAEVTAADADFAHKQAESDARIRKVKAAAMANIDKVAEDTISAIVERVAGVSPKAAQVKSALTRVKG
jgi:F-type H+-transporting ATPase subunit b